MYTGNHRVRALVERAGEGCRGPASGKSPDCYTKFSSAQDRIAVGPPSPSRRFYRRYYFTIRSRRAVFVFPRSLANDDYDVHRKYALPLFHTRIRTDDKMASSLKSQSCVFRYRRTFLSFPSYVLVNIRVRS